MKPEPSTWLISKIHWSPGAALAELTASNPRRRAATRAAGAQNERFRVGVWCVVSWFVIGLSWGLSLYGGMLGNPEPIGIGGGYRTISVGWPVERRYHPSPLVDLRVPIAKPEPAAISMRDPRPINDLGLGNRHAQRAVVDAVGTFIHYHEDLARAGLAEVGRPPEGRPDLAGGIAVLGSIQPGPHRR